jgi:hypothetical protein
MIDELDGSGHGLINVSSQPFLWRDLGKPQWNSVRLAGVTDEN